MKNTKRKLSPRKIGYLVVGGIAVVVFIKISLSNPALESLKSDNLSSTYTREYWIKQAKEKSKLWYQALNYCNTSSNPTPGCKTVEGVAWGMNAYKMPKGVHI